ncbi:alpha/beta hydrolase family protein [Xanthocytophaga flava]|uniref:alpha/beta hydrolase family protein n=1 Tax=Xanthocytophaga flava TaxID=3048013 RepID=UPI0028D54F0B|nr:acyl-CoA thioester hydrolase/BAAT C-terminal domain-containing protein [Xanthocytophaga flavus]MDJ1470319.1 acyl-CoA thioester hydrolase/BAAT C-terminal domain-containing protein [Xanthocytophaga flavus]
MPRSTGNKRLLRFFLSTLACLCLLALLTLGIIYQEFGPVEVSSIEMRKVREAGIIAEFFYPKGSKKLPIVISLAGSGGGMLEDKDMQLLALEGYAVLSLAYFKMEDLPNKLEEIPLEYFKQAIGWVSEQPVADPNKIIVLGISRGAELALLLASVYPQIKGVIAFAPGNIILPNAVDIGDSTPSHSSWTLAGKPFPFAPLQELQADNSKPIIPSLFATALT